MAIVILLCLGYGNLTIRDEESAMSDRFAGQPRGQTLDGAREIAQHIWGDPERWRSVYQLDREAFGLVSLSGRVVGFSRWIDQALERRVGKKRRRRRSAETLAATT
jgi:hypothetical protein